MFSIFFSCLIICVKIYVNECTYMERQRNRKTSKKKTDLIASQSDYVPCIFRLYILEGDIHVTLLFCTTHNM